MTSIGLWSKQINGAAGAVLAAVIVALTDDAKISVPEAFTITGALLLAFVGISFVRNALSGPLYYARAGAAGLAAFVGSVGTAVASDGWPPAAVAWVVALVSLLNALTVAVTPAARTSDADQFRDVKGV